MAVSAYANFAEFTQVYSPKGISEDDITSYWLPHGALKTNEALAGAGFTTPFSSNNETAKDLSIHFAYLGLLLRTRNQTDSEELRKDLLDRIGWIVSSGSPMILSDGKQLFPQGTSTDDIWSNTQDFKSVFDMRDAERQRVDPDFIDSLEVEDR